MLTVRVAYACTASQNERPSNGTLSRLDSIARPEVCAGRRRENPLNDNLFSHPVESQYVPPTHEGASDPIENPKFSDQEPQIQQ